MRKLYVLLLVLAFVMCLTPVAHAVAVSLDLFGGFVYDEEGGLLFPVNFVPVIEPPSFQPGPPGLRSALNSTGPYTGIAALAYDFTWNLPAVDDVLPLDRLLCSLFTLHCRHELAVPLKGMLKASNSLLEALHIVQDQSLACPDLLVLR